MKKMIINHLDKIFVTSDAATIMKEVLLIISNIKDGSITPGCKNASNGFKNARE